MQWCISLGTQKAILLRVLNGSSPSSPIRRLHPLHTSCKKRLHLWKRNCFSDAENPQDTRNYLTSTLSLCPPLAAVWPLPQGSTGQQAVLDSSALSWMGLPSRWDAHLTIQVRCPWCSSPQKAQAPPLPAQIWPNPQEGSPGCCLACSACVGAALWKHKLFLTSSSALFSLISSGLLLRAAKWLKKGSLPSVTTGTWHLPSANEMQV